MTMEFEDLLNSVGGFGRYQKTLAFVVMFPISAATAIFYVAVVFLASTPDHWCYVPEVAQSNISLQQQMSLIRPVEDPSCSTYDVNFTSIILSGQSFKNKNWPTKPCAQGWQYDYTDFDATGVTRWNMVCKDEHYSSLLKSMVFFGSAIGTPLFGHLSDRIGRKPVFFTLSLITALSEIGSTLIPNFLILFLLRAINGSTILVLYVNSYITVLELVDAKSRTMVNGICILAWTAGLCILPLTAWLTRNWIYLSCFCSASAFAFLFYWKLFPESPRWLISEGRYDEIFQILSKISKTNGKNVHETEELMKQIQKLGDAMNQEKESQSKTTSLDIVKYSELRRRFILITVCWVSATLSYYGLMLNIKNLYGNQFLNFFLMSVLEFPSHLLTWYCMTKIGRKPTSIGAFMLCAVACLIPVLLPDGSSMIGVASSLLGKFGSSAAYMILYQLAPELYPTPLRSFGISCSATIAVTATLSAPYIVDLAVYGKYIPFLVFSTVCVFAALCASFLPETLNRILPQTVEDVENCKNDEALSTKSFFPIKKKLWCFRARKLFIRQPSISLHFPTAISVIQIENYGETNSRKTDVSIQNCGS